VSGDGFFASGELDPHPYRAAMITRLSVAVLERAIRDAQLVEVGHRVKVCPIKAWPDREQRSLLTARGWLRDAANPMLRLWLSGAGVGVEQFVTSIAKRVVWTEQLEARARQHMGPPRRHPRWPSSSWPFRRAGDEQRKTQEEAWDLSQ
jgi:hypothetical protein